MAVAAEAAAGRDLFLVAAAAVAAVAAAAVFFVVVAFLFAAVAVAVVLGFGAAAAARVLIWAVVVVFGAFAAAVGVPGACFLARGILTEDGFLLLQRPPPKKNEKCKTLPPDHKGWKKQ